MRVSETTIVFPVSYVEALPMEIADFEESLILATTLPTETQLSVVEDVKVPHAMSFTFRASPLLTFMLAALIPDPYFTFTLFEIVTPA